MSKFFKSLNRPKKEAPPVPRALPEIQKEYSELIGKVGQAQYQAYAYTREVETLNRQLLNVNHEAKARQELDAKAEAEAKSAAIDASVEAIKEVNSETV